MSSRTSRFDEGGAAACCALWGQACREFRHDRRLPLSRGAAAVPRIVVTGLGWSLYFHNNMASLSVAGPVRAARIAPRHSGDVQGRVALRQQTPLYRLHRRHRRTPRRGRSFILPRAFLPIPLRCSRGTRRVQLDCCSRSGAAGAAQGGAGAGCRPGRRQHLARPRVLRLLGGEQRAHPVRRAGRQDWCGGRMGLRWLRGCRLCGSSFAEPAPPNRSTPPSLVLRRAGRVH